MKLKTSIFIIFFIVSILFISGCIESGSYQVAADSSLNVSGESKLYEDVTLIAGNNVSLLQDTTNKTIRINSTGGGEKIVKRITENHYKRT